MRVLRLPSLDTPVPASARRLPGNDGRFVEVSEDDADALLAGGAAPVREYVYDVPAPAPADAVAKESGEQAEGQETGGKARRRG
jgi:hypothetical protein